MSLLILSFDFSSDKISKHLHHLLNTSSTSPHIVSVCSSTDLFTSTTNNYQTIFTNSLKVDLLSHNDLLGFLILIDIATTNKLHLQHLSSITSILSYLNEKHSFQPILTFLIHASAFNQLYTSSLTSFNLNLIFSRIYSTVNGIIFQNIDQITDHQNYHFTIASQIASIFLPVSSLREDQQRWTKSVSIEFLQLIQHLLVNPEKKILVMKTKDLKKDLNSSSHALLLIQRGKPSLSNVELRLKNLDIWYSLEKNLQSTLIMNNDRMNQNLLEELILRPYENKLHMNQAYFYWLKKKFAIEDLNEQLARGIQLCKNILLDQ